VISQVLAIPPRRRDRAIVSYLTPTETDALLAAPDRTAWHGRRDHALLLLAVQTGLRVSELTALTRQDTHLGAGACCDRPAVAVSHLHSNNQGLTAHALVAPGWVFAGQPFEDGDGVVDGWATGAVG
jgi:integrase